MRSPAFRILLLLCFTLHFAVFFGSADLLIGWVPYRLAMPAPTWSFLPELAPLYLSMNLLFVVVFLKVKEEHLSPLFGSLCLQVVLAWPIFVLCPLEEIRLPFEPTSWWFRAADFLNLNGNLLPSLHVSYALTCALFYPRLLVLVWSLGIAASTLFTYQHYPIDLLAGAGLGLLCSLWCLTRGRIFCLCLGELLRCSFRHRRYALIACGLLAYLLTHRSRGWRALVGFCYLQRLDDLLDGHLVCQEEPELGARRQVQEWKSRTFSDDTLGRLAGELQRSLGQEELVIALIEEMIQDRIRVREHLLLEAGPLEEHLQRTFQLSLDLMLAASEAELTSLDVPGLTKLLAWCSLVRDLEEDLDLGLVNVPREIWDSENFEEWFLHIHNQARTRYQEIESTLEGLEHRSGHRILRLFHRSVQKYLSSHDSQELAGVLKRYKHSDRGSLFELELRPDSG